MKTNILGKKDSVFNEYIAELRDKEVQKDAMRFRFNMRRLGYIFAYEISKTLSYIEKDVVTSLGTTTMRVLKQYPVTATILRAGLPLHEGILDFFDRSPSAFISAYRKVYKDGHFNIHIDYSSSPELAGEYLILSDAMLASGSSMVLCYKELLNRGKPLHTHIVATIASVEGLAHVKSKLASSEVTLWIGAIDDEMTAQSYIVPGLGDAGDLAYGEKGE